MTLPTFTSYEAKAVECALAMLTGSATFRTLVGAADAAAAQSFVILADGGDAQDGTARAATGASVSLTQAHACLGATRFPSEGPYPADTYEKRSGEVLALIYLPPLANSTPPERYVRALNVAGAIRAELKAQQGAAGAFAHVGVGLTVHPIHDDPESPFRGEYVVELALAWRNT